MSKGYLPSLPHGWDLCPLKHACSLNPEVLSEATPEDQELLYVDISALEGGVSDLTPKPLRFGDAPSRARRVLRSGDTILSTVRTYLRAVAMFPQVDGPMVASTGFAVIRPNGKLLPRFAYWAALSEPFIENVVAHSDGVSYPAISPSVLGALQVPVPPRPVQQRIASFLDEKTARIDTLIAGKQRLLDLLHEYERSCASRLIARGLENRAMATTGNAFVPEAPSGWRVTSFKRAILAIDQGWSPQCEARPAEDGEWGVLKVGCVNGSAFDPNENKALPAELKPDRSCILKKGDVLMSRANTRELVGMAAVVDRDFGHLLLCDKLYRLHLRPDWLAAEYAVLLLRADGTRQQIELEANGASASMQNISQDVVRELQIAIPPLEEQRQIVEEVAALRHRCNELRAHVESHLNRLREYRTSLISAAVTGELDMDAYREAA